MKKSKTQTLLLSFVGFALFFFVLNRIFFFSPTLLETTAAYVMHPFVLIQQHILHPVKKSIKLRSTVQELCYENQMLIEKNHDLQAENVQLKASSVYMNDVKELIDFKQNYQTDCMTLVHIVLKHYADDGHYIVIDAGADKGVCVDMVAVYKNFLLGRVMEVYPRLSKVMLITDQRCKVASVCSTSNVHGLHEGCNTLDETKLTHVSHLLQLTDNDLILSSGEGLVFPQGFGLGKIKTYELEGVQYRVAVEPLIDINTIDYCFLIKKKNDY